MVKKLKDPLYGYICIPSNIVYNIIDSAPFQRLRRVSQTSYAPLYSSAVHNRFVHSLGVYYLGERAGKTLVEEIKKKLKGDFDDHQALDRIYKIFCLACLLHDVGHAPFSHTGEEFYLDERQGYEIIHTLLKEQVNCCDFAKDVPSLKTDSAAPHEIMSAVVGLKEYSSFFRNDEERGFFARCITGYRYSLKTKLNSIRNCFIQLLNSKVIDVDKLDYLIRDAYITGYDTVKIDYTRLLSALTIIISPLKEDDDQESVECGDQVYYELAYYKSAISVIENVVYAHDSERKWIQTHPVILYESYILQHVMNFLSKQLDTDSGKLFSSETLSAEGLKLQDNIVIRLLSDDDIVYLMKKYYLKESLVKEYFNRNIRRHPLWKSEAEYKAIMLSKSTGGKFIDDLERALKVTAEYLSKNTENWLINRKLAETIETELRELPESNLDSRSKEIQSKNKKNILKVVDCLLEYAGQIGYSGDYILIKATQFNTGFLKPDFSQIKIVFPGKDSESVITFGEYVSSVTGIKKARDDFFYLYYDREKGQNEKMNANDVCLQLFKAFMS